MSARGFGKYPPPLGNALAGAVARTVAELERQMPLSAKEVKHWLTYLAGSDDPADYYLRRGDLPMFLFPWFLEKELGARDDAFLFDRVYSTVNGFYYIRLLDNVTDGHAPEETALLPALGFFHTQFQLPYQNHFEAGHPFWNDFEAIWSHSADVTLRDLKLKRLTRTQFVRVAAQKTCAVKIPLAAVAHKYRTSHRLRAWSRFLDAYGCWHQMANDLLHWHEDLSLNTATYFLSQAKPHTRTPESAAEWVMREGFTIGLQELDNWMTGARACARALANADLLRFLDFKAARVQKQTAEMQATLKAAAGLSSLLFS